MTEATRGEGVFFPARRADGATKHVLYRLFVVKGQYFGVYLSAPEKSFSGLRPQFDTAAATFAVPS